MTEIPEHLLKRSRERRSALGDDAGAGDASPAATPATTQSAAPAAAPASAAPAGRAAAPAVPAAPAPKPDSPVVAAYKRRRKIPFWAMLGLALLPLWALMYARAVTTQAREVAGPLGVGATAYSGCASCHGADGGGGVGYKFADGEVLKTFPHIEDQIRWVYYATGAYNAAGVTIAGDPNRDGGPHVVGALGNMLGQSVNTEGALTDAELLAVVCHERYTLGGADPTGTEYSAEYEKWCAEGSEIYADLEGGGDIRTLSDRFEGIIPIGDAPAPGSPAGS